VIALVRQYATRAYLLHISTADELALIKAAKAENLPVFAEVTPHHLFLHDQAYAELKGRAVMNPPLRAPSHQEALFDGIRNGVIDTLGSDHAPHTATEKQQPYACCPAGVPGIETVLPLLLNAYHEKLLTLAQIVNLTSTRAREIFRLPATDDKTLVDLQRVDRVLESKLKTKCGWSPFANINLRGWPAYTILNNHCYDLAKL
jgi:dihydroorotase